MQITFITNNQGTDVFEINHDAIYQKIAEYITSLQAPEELVVKTPVGNACFQLVPSAGKFFVREAYNNIPTFSNEPCKPIYLVCVNPEHNNYKYYKLEDVGNGEIKATYGRIGADSNEVFGERTHYYPKRMYFIKVLEKLNKGYQDMTSIYLSDTSEEQTDENTAKSKKTTKSTVSSELFKMLKAYSNHVIKTSCISTNITKPMIDKTRELLEEIYEVSDVDDFNSVLLKILAISPRRVRDVNALLASSKTDFEDIISREESLLMAMEGVYATHTPAVDNKASEDFSKYNIKIYEATDKQKEQVLSHLSTNLQGKVKQIYRVIDAEQKAHFDAYLKAKNIKKVKQFWHGSKNCNWLSIVINRLKLNPSAAITGKMFGYGIYFAPSSEKSWNYTSYRGTYWANGKDDKGFMGLYACAYGSPHDVYSAQSFTQSYLDGIGKNCVHAHAGSYLRNDEIIFYDEDAVLLNYIVEFE